MPVVGTRCFGTGRVFCSALPHAASEKSFAVTCSDVPRPDHPVRQRQRSRRHDRRVQEHSRHPLRGAGAARNPDAEVFAHAAATIKTCTDTTLKRGGETCVLRGGREGCETLLNTDFWRVRARGDPGPASVRAARKIRSVRLEDAVGRKGPPRFTVLAHTFSMSRPKQ
jgi:hypothetical protein